jgi:ribonuclease G
MISELLREGQEILVQVAKEPLGKKGARITSHIALPGRYLVYMPTVDHVGVSRKIASDEERSRLKRIIHDNRNGLPGGFIVRTAAEGRGEDEFIQDIRFLGNLWADIRSKSEKKSAPTLIHRDLNLVQRLLRDQLSQDYRAIRIDNEAEFATVLDFVNKFQPALVNRVKLHLKDTPIFEEYGLNTEIDKALRPKVWLKSGGYIVINQTEALVAIDVNTGKFVGKSNRLEDTIVKTNLDAVHEVVRQIRLRNLGGIIVVDFIDMEEKKNRQRVMAALEEALRVDRSPSKVLQFNDFGLVAITRKRTQPSLERTLCKPCPVCNGSGWSKSAETICYDVQQELKKMAHMLEGKEITIRLNPEVAKILKSGEFVSIQDLEEWTKKDIIVKSDPLLHEEHFDIF